MRQASPLFDTGTIPAVTDGTQGSILTIVIPNPRSDNPVKAFVAAAVALTVTAGLVTGCSGSGGASAVSCSAPPGTQLRTAAGNTAGTFHVLGAGLAAKVAGVTGGKVQPTVVETDGRRRTSTN